MADDTSEQDTPAHKLKFNHQPSETFTAAVAALEALAEAEGEGAVQYAFAEVVWAQRRDAYAADREVERGDGFWNLSQLMSSEHLKQRFRDGDSKTPFFADHATLWSHGNEPSTFVFQPYGLTWGEMQRIVVFCQEYGLEACVDASYSWHYPGMSVLVELRTKQENPDLGLFRAK